jgi:peroxiredoxin Q/BCP
MMKGIWISDFLGNLIYRRMVDAMKQHKEQQTVQVGKKVADFTLPAADGSSFTLSRHIGRKLVIYFYPQDLTPTCTQESCDFRDYTEQFHAAGAEVIGISPDPVKSHNKFIDKLGLTFPLLSDENLAVSHLFDVWQLKKLYGREYMGIERSTFVIDEQGILRQAWRKVRLKNHVSDVLA